MQRVRQVADRLGIYLINSVDPFHLEGIKTIMYRVLEGLGWEVPDWMSYPAATWEAQALSVRPSSSWPIWA